MPTESRIRSINWGMVLCCLAYLGIILCLLTLNIDPPTKKAAAIQAMNIDHDNNSLTISGNQIDNETTVVLTPTVQPLATIVSTSSTCGKTTDIAVQNQHAWITNGSDGLLSYDLTNPTHPTLSGVLPLPCNTWQLAVQQNAAFVAGGRDGLFGVDITNPRQPQLAFNKYANMIVLDVATINNITTIVTVKHGVIFLNTNDLYHPKELLRVPVSGNLQAVTIHNNHIYVVGKQQMRGILYIFDITNNNQPKQIAQLQLPHPAWDNIAMGATLFVAIGHDGLLSVDISSPQNPILLPAQTTTHNCYGLCRNNNNLFIASAMNEIYQYQKHGNTLTYLTTFSMQNRCRRLATYQNLILSTASDSGFTIIDPQNGGTQQSTTVPIKIDTNKSTLSYDAGILCLNTKQDLHIFSIQDADHIKEIDSIHFTNVIRTITNNQHYAYITLSNDELHIIDLTPTTTQRSVSVMHWPAKIRNIIVNGENLYIHQSNKSRHKILKVDLHNIEHPHIYSTPINSTRQTNSAIYNSRLYITTIPNGLQVYQLDDTAVPTLLGQLKYHAPMQNISIFCAIAFPKTEHNKYAFIINGNYGLLSVDISDPQHMKIVDSIDLAGFCNAITIEGHYAFISVKYKTKIIDISNPARLKKIYELSNTRSTTIAQNKLIQINTNGLLITALPTPLTTISSSNAKSTFQLPDNLPTGYYDLQFSGHNNFIRYEELLHFSHINGWTLTRKLVPSP